MQKQQYLNNNRQLYQQNNHVGEAHHQSVDIQNRMNVLRPKAFQTNQFWAPHLKEECGVFGKAGNSAVLVPLLTRSCYLILQQWWFCHWLMGDAAAIKPFKGGTTATAPSYEEPEVLIQYSTKVLECFRTAVRLRMVQFGGSLQP